MKQEHTRPSATGDQYVIEASPLRDPLFIKIIGTAILMSLVIGVLYIYWGHGPVVAEIPWLVPVANVFSVLTVFMTAFLAIGRYLVLREAVSYWVGIAYAGLGIGVVFFILAFPGLLPQGRAILARLPNTSAWIGFMAQSVFIVFILAAFFMRWPEHQALAGRRWLWFTLAWLSLFILINVFSLVFERYIPLLVAPDGSFTSLNLAWNWTSNVFLGIIVILATRHYLRSRNVLMGYVAINFVLLFFATVTALIGARRFDLWWILYRLLYVSGYLIIMIGLLSEYVSLFRRESEGRLMLEAILANIPVGLAITGGPPDYPLARVSRHGLDMNQRPAERLIGAPAGQHQAAWKIYLSDGVTQPQADQMPLYRAIQFGEDTRNMEMMMETHDGRKIPVLVNAAPIRDAVGQIVAAINTWLDISEIKQAQALLKDRNDALQKYAAELEHANRDLQNFTVMASHDLQEPLRKIEVLGDTVLKSAFNLDEMLIDRIQRMRKSAEQMRKMVDALLQLSLVSTDTHSFQPVDLRQIIIEILADKKEQIGQSGDAMGVGELPTVEADPVQMRNLFLQLIENAIKFQPPDGNPHIMVTASLPTGDFVQILVKDNGIGFDEAYSGHLFEPFERLVDKGQQQYDGVGMGLAICRRIVERHGGKIAAHSNPGQGTTIIVTLPVQQHTVK